MSRLAAPNARRAALRAILGAPMLAGLAALLVLAGGRALDPEPLPTVRTRGFDVYQILAPRAPVSMPVVIVAVDEASLSEFGQWPWPRTRLAELLRRVQAFDPIIVGFDMLFPEADRMSPRGLAEALPELPPDARAALRALPDNDAVFADAVAARPTVLSAYFGGAGPGAPLRTPPVVAAGHAPLAAMDRVGDKVLQNIETLRAQAAAPGVANVRGEADGVVRRLPLLFRTDADVVAPSLNAEILRAAVGGPPIELRSRGGAGLASVGLGPLTIPTQPDGRMWVHFSPSSSDRFISAADVLNGTANPEQFRQKVVLIGLT
ncbi:MAG: CHASE2 domain-containing protein, partial [Pseudomonadota bacterium]